MKAHDFKPKKSDLSPNERLQQNVIQLFKQGRNIRKIAKITKMSSTRIIHCLPEDLIAKQIEELLKKGMTNTEIGLKLGMDRKTVKTRAEKAGIADINVSRIIDLFLNEIPINEIAKQLNMKTQQVITQIPEDKRRERLKTLYFDYQLSYNQITKQLGISHSSLKNWLKRYDLMNRHTNAGKKFKQYPNKEIIWDYLCLNSIESITKKRGFAKTTIRRILNEARVKRYSTLALIRKHVDNNYNIPINPYLSEVITGELLGDGNLSSSQSTSDKVISRAQYLKAVERLQKFQIQRLEDLELAIINFNDAIETIRHFRMSRLNFVMSLLAIPWAFHIKNIFEKNGIPMSYKINDANMISAKHHTVSVWSRFTVQLKELYEQWYPNGKRFVPLNIELSPNTLLHWFIGDGSLGDSRILICTQSFSTTNVEDLVDILNKSLQIRSHWRYDSNDLPVIAIERINDVKDFFEYLEHANSKSLSLAKEIYPWKFDRDLLKRDVMKSEWYPEILKKYIGKESDNISSLLERTIRQQYFKDN